MAWSDNNLQSYTSSKTIGECEDATAFIEKNLLSVPIENACLIW